MGRGRMNRTISIPLPRSESGKTRHKCPNPSCEPKEFLLGSFPSDRVVADGVEPRRLPGTAGTTCPYCGQDAEDDAFQHPVDREYVRKRIDQETRKIADEVLDDIHGQLTDVFRGFNTLGRGLLGISAKVSRSPPPFIPPVRLPSHSDLLRNVVCGICSREYGVYGLALFCPDCGCANLLTHFAREEEIIRHELEDADKLRESGERERYQRKIGNCIEDAASVGEGFLKRVYQHVVHEERDAAEAQKLCERIGNAFQNLDRAVQLYAAVGIDPFKSLSDSERHLFRVSMARRHVVTHNLGIVDDKYVQKTGDGLPEQNLSLRGEDVTSFMQLLKRVVAALGTDVLDLKRPRMKEES